MNETEFMSEMSDFQLFLALLRDGWMDGWTDQQTDKVCYRGAMAHLESTQG